MRIYCYFVIMIIRAANRITQDSNMIKSKDFFAFLQPTFNLRVKLHLVRISECVVLVKDYISDAMLMKRSEVNVADGLNMQMRLEIFSIKEKSLQEDFNSCCIDILS